MIDLYKLPERRFFFMSYKLHQLKLNLAGLDPRYVRLALVILSLTLFVLGAGAPEGPSDLGR